MNLMYYLCFVLLFLLVAGSVKQPSNENFDWLIGSWERSNEKADRSSFEEWEKESDQEYTGKGWTMLDGDTTFIEYLVLKKDSSGWFYQATVPHNDSPVGFYLSRFSETNFIAENPNHDFPKKITYSRLGKQKMIVTISDNDKSIEFQFNRIHKK